MKYEVGTFVVKQDVSKPLLTNVTKSLWNVTINLQSHSVIQQYLSCANYIIPLNTGWQAWVKQTLYKPTNSSNSQRS